MNTVCTAQTLSRARSFKYFQVPVHSHGLTHVGTYTSQTNACEVCEMRNSHPTRSIPYIELLLSPSVTINDHGLISNHARQPTPVQMDSLALSTFCHAIRGVQHSRATYTSALHDTLTFLYPEDILHQSSAQTGNTSVSSIGAPVHKHPGRHEHDGAEQRGGVVHAGCILTPWCTEALLCQQQDDIST